ncbi:MAG: Plug domain-containing protein [Ignavibacteriales bacterium]|nr:Plug domain-containing protein [Ignavibacteriales bacterium]
MLSIQEGSGGQEGNATINVRGGRGSEVLYIVDGVPQNNLYNRGTVAQVSNIAIDQISFQVGGYEAKYGQAQSGIVNVTTKSGQPYYNLFIDVLSSDVLNTDPSGSNLYSGSLSGPIIPGIPEHTIFLIWRKRLVCKMLILRQFQLNFGHLKMELSWMNQ